MPRQHTNRGALLASNLPQLQNLIKRDPPAYRDEFLQQWNHFQSIQRIWKTEPALVEGEQRFRELVSFIAQVAQCYPNETKEFPNELASLLRDNYSTLSPDLRRSFVQNLVTLRNKEVITSIDLLRNLFPLLPRTSSSSLRSNIRKIILTDIKTANARTKNHKLNRAVQAMLFTMIERGMDGEIMGDKGKLRSKPANASNPTGGFTVPEGTKGNEALWAVLLTKELWRKGVWNDSKSVSIVSLGCFHPVAKVQSASLHFFLGEEDEEDSSDSEVEGPDIKSLQHRREINKKTRSGERKMAKASKIAKKKRKENTQAIQPNFPAIQLVNDPQGFAEKLYDGLVKYDKRYSLDHKILIMQLLTRLISQHKLTVLPFYTYILKYLQPHQLRIPTILACLVQSVHDLTPPDILYPVVRKIAQEFCHPGVGPEVVAAGINAIRGVCGRQPWCLGGGEDKPDGENDDTGESIEEDGSALLQDLVEYRKSKDKGVMVAARSLLQLYREVNPGLLRRRERGKAASMGVSSGAKAVPYGHQRDTVNDIDGLDLLEAYLEEEKTKQGSDIEMDHNGDDEKAWEGWDAETDSSSESSGGWMDVDSDGDDAFNVSDSEDGKTTGGNPDNANGEKGKDAEEAPAKTKKMSTLAATKILTPADFSLLQELRVKQAQQAVDAGTGSKRKLAALQAQKKATATITEEAPPAGIVTEANILGVRKKAKADYEERMASIAKGREGREKFGSAKGKKKKEAMSSTTNKEKQRNKPLMMAKQSAAVRAKKMASLKEKQKRIRAHIDRAKKAHH